MDEIAEFLKIRESTKKGYAEAYEGDGVQLGYTAPTALRRAVVGRQRANTLTCNSQMGVVVKDEINEKDYVLRIRKLTPTECFRLQGWCFKREDGTWDDTAIEKARAQGVSDSQLYRQAGNGCSANVVEAIGRRLKELEEQGENNA